MCFAVEHRQCREFPPVAFFRMNEREQKLLISVKESAVVTLICRTKDKESHQSFEVRRVISEGLDRVSFSLESESDVKPSSQIEISPLAKGP